MTNVIKGTKGFTRRPVEERFWEKVDKSNGSDSCWNWTGAHDGRGYGQIYVDGAVMRATKLAWELHNKTTFPSGMEACHKCDNPSCVNPDHIWPGTHAQNMRDASEKGRTYSPKGVKLTPRTHCKHGHAFTKENTIHKKTGMECIACKRINDAKRWSKERSERESLGEKVVNRQDKRGDFSLIGIDHV